MTEIEYTGHPSDKALVTSPNEWKKFRETPMWVDIKNFLEDKVAIATDQLLDTDPTDVSRLAELQQEIKVTGIMLKLPELMAEWSEAQLKHNQAARKR